MGKLARKVGIGTVVFIVAVLLSAAGRLPQVSNPADVDWNIQSQLSDDQQGNNQNISDTSQGQSTDGQDITDLQTNQADLGTGESHDHQEIDHSDPNGGSGTGYDRWSEDGDINQDGKGNRTEHYEVITEKDGECEKTTTDETWDSKGNHTTHTEDPTPVPCMSFGLEVSLEGSADLGGISVTYGPDTITIPLVLNKNDSYTGSYSGQFHATISGSDCSGSGVYPVSFDVTAKKDEFDEMTITTKNSVGAAISVACSDSSASRSIPPTKYTKTFTLPAEDGASKKNTTPDGNVTWTYMLKDGKTRAH